jgi:regulator of protease activity HflC (stomatin/prohibitin superfamily)
MYRTKARREVVKDPTTGEEVTKVFNEIMYDPKTGQPIREQNPMQGMGIDVSNFEIKDFIYSKKVRMQIEQQQENIMAIETAKAEALKAEQQEKTAEMKGKAAVTKAQYEKEEEKIRAVVDAKKEKEVAELQAMKELEVAKLQKKAAVEQKQREILLGQGESERKKLVMQADGALAKKLEAWKDVNFRYAEAIQNYKGQWVPTVMMGGEGGKSGNGAQDLINLLSVKTAKDLALDLNIKGKR